MPNPWEIPKVVWLKPGKIRVCVPARWTASKVILFIQSVTHDQPTFGWAYVDESRKTCPDRSMVHVDFRSFIPSRKGAMR